jgi:capsular exopolysaccharide synthesis family protein
MALAGQLTLPGHGTTTPPRTIGITSCSAGEGVTTVAVNLAIAAAQVSKQPILLIDANVKSPSIAQLFRLKPSPGFTDVTSGTVDIAGAIHETSVENLAVLPAGTVGRGGGVVCDPAAVEQMLNGLLEIYGTIVFDLPPAAGPSVCFSLAGLLDGVLLVVESEQVRTQVARRAKKWLTDRDANLLGVVLNKRREHIPEWLYRRF